MAAPTPELSEADVRSFVTDSSDFSFEMQTLKELRSAGYECEHAATYQGPVTEKIREYDIRAQRQLLGATLKLAIECKFVGADSPLVVHATPRTAAEVYLSLLLRAGNGGFHYEHSLSHPAGDVYPEGEPVGRKIDQPQRQKNGSLKSVDRETFEKWLQAVHGTFGILEAAAQQPWNGRFSLAVVPILVVPQGRLWQVDYSAGGAVVQEARRVDRATLILRHRWRISHGAIVEFSISHLEIITAPAMNDRLGQLFIAAQYGVSYLDGL